MNAVVSMLGGPARSVVEEGAMRPPVIGRIRPGIKVLTSKARGNQEAASFTTRWSPPVSRSRRSAK